MEDTPERVPYALKEFLNIVLPPLVKNKQWPEPPTEPVVEPVEESKLSSIKLHKAHAVMKISVLTSQFLSEAADIDLYDDPSRLPLSLDHSKLSFKDHHGDKNCRKRVEYDERIKKEVFTTATTGESYPLIEFERVILATLSYALRTIAKNSSVMISPPGPNPIEVNGHAGAPQIAAPAPPNADFKYLFQRVDLDKPNVTRIQDEDFYTSSLNVHGWVCDVKHVNPDREYSVLLVFCNPEVWNNQFFDQLLVDRKKPLPSSSSANSLVHRLTEFCMARRIKNVIITSQNRWVFGVYAPEKGLNGSHSCLHFFPPMLFMSHGPALRTNKLYIPRKVQDLLKGAKEEEKWGVGVLAVAAFWILRASKSLSEFTAAFKAAREPTRVEPEPPKVKKKKGGKTWYEEPEFLSEEEFPYEPWIVKLPSKRKARNEPTPPSSDEEPEPVRTLLPICDVNGVPHALVPSGELVELSRIQPRWTPSDDNNLKPKKKKKTPAELAKSLERKKARASYGGKTIPGGLNIATARNIVGALPPVAAPMWTQPAAIVAHSLAPTGGPLLPFPRRTTRSGTAAAVADAAVALPSDGMSSPIASTSGAVGSNAVAGPSTPIRASRTARSSTQAPAAPIAGPSTSTRVNHSAAHASGSSLAAVAGDAIPSTSKGKGKAVSKGEPN